VKSQRGVWGWGEEQGEASKRVFEQSGDTQGKGGGEGAPKKKGKSSCTATKKKEKDRKGPPPFYQPRRGKLSSVPTSCEKVWDGLKKGRKRKKKKKKFRAGLPYQRIFKA